MVLYEGMRPACVGAAVGLALSIMTSRLMIYVVPVAYHVSVGTYAVVASMVLSTACARE